MYNISIRVVRRLLRTIREELGLTARDLMELTGTPIATIRGRESRGIITPEIVTEYIENLDLTEEQDKLLRDTRKSFWEYDESKSPITNELRRIRFGLGRPGSHLSRLMGYSKGYWKQLEYRGTPLMMYDFDALCDYFRISTTTLRRFKIIVERDYNNKPIPEGYKTDNPEIQEPEDLYEGVEVIVDSEEYYDLVEEIEMEYGSVEYASEEDPKLLRLRSMEGIIYYDDNSGF